jgi:hypothetical protein
MNPSNNPTADQSPLHRYCFKIDNPMQTFEKVLPLLTMISDEEIDEIKEVIGEAKSDLEIDIAYPISEALADKIDHNIEILESQDDEDWAALGRIMPTNNLHLTPKKLVLDVVNPDSETEAVENLKKLLGTLGTLTEVTYIPKAEVMDYIDLVYGDLEDEGGEDFDFADDDEEDEDSEFKGKGYKN